MLRDKQKIPEGNWKIWLLLAGRGFGKTTAGALAVKKLIDEEKVFNVAFIGETLYETRVIMLENCLFKYVNEFVFNPSLKVVKIKKCICRLFGGDRYDKLRGFEFDLVWIDEFAKIKNAFDLYQQVLLCLRKNETKLIITTTPKNISILKEIIKENNVVITQGSTFENSSNLSDIFLSNIVGLEKTSFGRQEIYGEIIEEDSLWKTEDILYEKIENCNQYSLGVDPAVGSGVTGIILSGFKNDKYYILDDFSGNYNSYEWIYLVVDIFKKYKCIICIETNQGGNLIEGLFKNIYPDIIKYIKQYRSSISKYARAFSLYNKYKQNIIFHNKKLLELEKEMLYNPKDRVDALVFSILGFGLSKIYFI